MRTTFDAQADAAYITLVPKIEPGSSVRNIEAQGVKGGSVILDLDATGKLLGIEVIGARRLLHATFLAEAEQIDE